MNRMAVVDRIKELEQQLEREKAGMTAAELNEQLEKSIYRADKLVDKIELLARKNNHLIVALEKIARELRLPERMDQHRCYTIAVTALDRARKTI